MKCIHNLMQKIMQSHFHVLLLFIDLSHHLIRPLALLVAVVVQSVDMYVCMYSKIHVADEIFFAWILGSFDFERRLRGRLGCRDLLRLPHAAVAAKWV